MIINNQFKAINAYIAPNYHYMPMILIISPMNQNIH